MAVTITIGGVDRTNKMLLNQISVDMTLGSDWEATINVRDLDSTASAYRPTLDQTITLADGATTLLHGTVTRVQDKPIGDPSVGTLTIITARAKSQVVDQIVVNETYTAGQTRKAIVTDLRTKYLNAYGITIDASMANGATLEAQVFKDVTLREVLNHISAITGDVWRITPADELQFFSAGTKTAGYSLTAANKFAIGAVTWEKTRQRYVNSVRLRYGTESQVPKTQTIVGNGSLDHWALDYDSARNADNYILSAGYVTDDGVFSPLSEYPSGGTTWMFDPATNQLRRSSALGNTKVATFVYNAQFPQVITVEDAGEIASNGRYSAIFEAPDIFDKNAATELAIGLKRRGLAVPQWVHVNTRQGFVMPGDQITLTFADRLISGNHLITQVRATSIARGSILYELTCLSGGETQETWTDQLKNAIGAGGSNASGGTISGAAVPNFSGRFDEDVSAWTGFDDVATGFESKLTTYGNSGGAGPALLLGRDDAAYRWVITADSDHGSTPGSTARLRLHIPRRGSSIEGALLLVEADALDDNFVVLPGQAANLYLGDYAAKISGVSGGDARIEGILCADCMATSGYFERFRTTRLGEWISPSYSAGDFTASSGTWTVDSGDIDTYAYTLIGKTMIVAFEINNTDVSATPTNLNIKVPGGFTVAKRTRAWAQVSDAGGAFQSAVCAVNAGATVINVYKDSTGTNTYASTSGDNTAVHGQIAFEVQ